MKFTGNYIMFYNSITLKDICFSKFITFTLKSLSSSSRQTCLTLDQLFPRQYQDEEGFELSREETHHLVSTEKLFHLGSTSTTLCHKSRPSSDFHLIHDHSERLIFYYGHFMVTFKRYFHL